MCSENDAYYCLEARAATICLSVAQSTDSQTNGNTTKRLIMTGPLSTAMQPETRNAVGRRASQPEPPE